MDKQQKYEELLTQYRETCQEIFNLQIPVAAGCDRLTAISKQLDHIEQEHGINWRN